MPATKIQNLMLSHCLGQCSRAPLNDHRFGGAHGLNPNSKVLVSEVGNQSVVMSGGKIAGKAPPLRLSAVRIGFLRHDADFSSSCLDEHAMSISSDA
jgi:hypothetical protein